MYFPSSDTNTMGAEGSPVPVSAPSILYTLLGGLYTSKPAYFEARIEMRSFWWRFPVIIACAKMMILFLHMHPSAVAEDSSALIDPILKGSWTLVDLSIPPDGLNSSTSRNTSSQEKNHYKALATFCEIDWSVHQRNPSQTSFFDDLRGESPSCQQNSRTVDLYDFMKQVRAFDAQHTGDEFITHRASPVSGMVFHQSRCGSTLAANMLAAFDPPRTRVYSEHFPPITALRACALVGCHDEHTHIQLIRDVFYMLGRTPKHENIQHVFFKSNSGGMFIDKFTTAFPDAPWAYLYRDSIEIMQSHFPASAQTDPNQDNNNDVPCARNYRNPHQPHFTLQVLQAKNVTYDQLTKTEYCAAHLAGISRSVLHEHERTGRGRFINYLDMPAAMWETLLPVDFGIALDASMVDRMHQVTGHYSKGGRHHARSVVVPEEQGNATHPWHSDTLRKRAAATATIHDAVNRYCPDTYELLETAARKQRASEQSIPRN